MRPVGEADEVRRVEWLASGGGGCRFVPADAGLMLVLRVWSLGTVQSYFAVCNSQKKG